MTMPVSHQAVSDTQLLMDDCFCEACNHFQHLCAVPCSVQV